MCIPQPQSDIHAGDMVINEMKHQMFQPSYVAHLVAWSGEGQTTKALFLYDEDVQCLNFST